MIGYSVPVTQSPAVLACAVEVSVSGAVVSFEVEHTNFVGAVKTVSLVDGFKGSGLVV